MTGVAAPPKEFIRHRILEEDRGYKTPCWVWRLGLNENGYAKAHISMFGRNIRVHRAAYVLWKGPIPDGLVIDHLCRVRNCCNPEHLEAVTVAENTRRTIPFFFPHLANGLCARGHRLDGANLHYDPRGSRVCRTCRRESAKQWARRYRARLKAVP